MISYPIEFDNVELGVVVEVVVGIGLEVVVGFVVVIVLGIDFEAEVDTVDLVESIEGMKGNRVGIGIEIVVVRQIGEDPFVDRRFVELRLVE